MPRATWKATRSVGKPLKGLLDNWLRGHSLPRASSCHVHSTGCPMTSTRDIRFRPEHAIWRGEERNFELQLLPLGWLYKSPVDVWVNTRAGGEPQRLTADSRLFAMGPLIGEATTSAPYAFSGFRVHGPLNRVDYFDEIAVFQGASYFRAVGRGLGYGLSARGLAIATGRPEGEEFPFFRAFWIERPERGASEVVVHALLDSPSTTGAYRFVIAPGATTTMDVEATLFPRRSMPFAGLAPLTSMYLHGAAQRRIRDDFRPAVHDSEGLAILNGRGECLWRPLANPRRLQASAFVDTDPKGFGLCQRDRAFASYQDLEARYERRPTAWVEPKGRWGAGAVELIEIPAEEEIHDNIVAFWRPAAPIAPGKPMRFAYRLHWGEAIPVPWSGIRAGKTHRGRHANNKQTGSTVFVVDFDGPAAGDLGSLPEAEVSASAGTLAHVVVQKNPEIAGFRVSFELDPGQAEIVELRLGLKSAGQLISENWLYRWTQT